MPAKGSCCCCSKCGVQLPPEANGCCLCICSHICVEVRNIEVGGNCDCIASFVLIDWDKSQCAYVGSVVCGSLTIDVKFDVKKCSDGTCRLCLTSECLGLTGTCSSGTSCNEFTPGNKFGDCGKYLRDCDQSGGWNETWNVNATGCLPSESQIACPSVEIHVTCYPRINPAGGGMARLCKDCDCVCECVVISWEESSCFGSESKLVCWDGDWTATLNPCLLYSGTPQVVTVLLVRDEPTGCCWWKVTISKGVFAIGYPGEGTAIALIKTACPEVDITLGVDLGDGESGFLDVICASCSDIYDICCACSILEDRYLLNGPLKLTISGAITGECVMNTATAEEHPGSCAGWTTAGSGFCGPLDDPCSLFLQPGDPGIHFHCPQGKTLEDLVLEAVLSNLGCDFAVGVTPTVCGSCKAQKPTEITCDPFYAKFVFPLVDVEPGGCGSCSEVVFELSIP